MTNIGDGFEIDGMLLPWGTTLAAFAANAGQEPPMGRGEIAMACGPAYGLPAISAALSAPRPDRPVTQLRYEIAAGRAPKTDSEEWAARLSAWLGAPEEAGYHALPSGDSSGSVLWYGNWRSGDIGIGLSVYGAPRITPYGAAGGCLWLSPSEERLAAPYVVDRDTDCCLLATFCDRMTGCEIFSLSAEQVARAQGRQRPARLSLWSPEILDTPGALRSRLSTRQFALWTSGSDRIWAASTLWDSRAFELGETVKIDRVDLKPAKGGGWSGLEIGAWSVRDMPGSTGIAAAAAFLERIDGVTMVRHEGYDC